MNFHLQKIKSSNSGEEDEFAKLTDKGIDSNNKIGSLNKNKTFMGHCFTENQLQSTNELEQS